MSEYNGPVGSRRKPLVINTDRSQAEIIAERRQRRADMLAGLAKGERKMTQLNVNIRKLHADAVIPVYATDGSAGFDLVAVDDVIVRPGDTVKVPLGLAFEIPEGYVMIVCMRSGIALKTKLRQPNGIGVIDSDYRGEVAMMFDNISPALPIEEYCEWPTFIDGTEAVGANLLGGEIIIRKGDRVAQAFIQPLPRATFTVVDELSETERGTGGFGHTGITL